MAITKNQNGSISISEFIAGYLVTKTYYGYTIKESKQLFRKEYKNGND